MNELLLANYQILNMGVRNINIKIEDIETVLYSLLTQFKVGYSIEGYSNGNMIKVGGFGLKILFVTGAEFENKVLKDWRIVWVYPDFTLDEAKDKIIWGLVKGGYFHYLRMNYKRTFDQMFYFQNWGNRLAKYRKKIYKDLPKYNYLRELNNDAMGSPTSYVLSIDPGFYDWVFES